MDEPLVVYRFSGKVMKCFQRHAYGKTLQLLCQKYEFKIILMSYDK